MNVFGRFGKKKEEDSSGRSAAKSLGDLPPDVASRLLCVKSETELAALLRDHPEAAGVAASMRRGSSLDDEALLRQRRKFRERASGRGTSQR
jgi:hypothetical protein